MSTNYSEPPDALDRDLVLQFFWRFSGFECALKREGFLRQQRPPDPGNTAEPDWKAFARAIHGRFGEVKKTSFQEAVAFLVRDPPRRQVVRDGSLGWQPLSRMDKDSDEDFLLLLVRTIRNNLFHGGKYPDGPIDEVARDQDLLRAALEVLEACYELHPGIARWASAA